MNQFIVKGQWRQFKGEIRRQWGKLTHNHGGQVKGEYEKLAGRIQERYGRTREEAQEQIEEYVRRHTTATN